jgi:hypothetical protein
MYRKTQTPHFWTSASNGRIRNSFITEVGTQIRKYNIKIWANI